MASWSEEDDVILRRAWSEKKMSAEQIAQTFFRPRSRNAIIGRAHRLGLTMNRKPTERASAISTVPTNRQQRMNNNPLGWNAKRAKKIKLDPRITFAPPIDTEITELPPDQSSFACTLAELKDTSCRWPLGDPREASFRYCGAHRHDSLPYCLRHAEIAYPAMRRAEPSKSEAA